MALPFFSINICGFYDEKSEILRLQRYRRRQPSCLRFALPVPSCLCRASHFVRVFQISSKSVDKRRKYRNFTVSMALMLVIHPKKFGARGDLTLTEYFLPRKTSQIVFVASKSVVWCSLFDNQLTSKIAHFFTFSLIKVPPKFAV